MIDHNDLMQEMLYIDKLSRNERIKLAYRRRKDQLATHSKWMETEEYQSNSKPRPKNRKGIRFTADLELMDIASRNALEEMQSLLQSGIDPNETNHDGLTALHQCCIDGSQEMVNLLIKNGANVNVKDRDLWTPLHAAATCGHFKIVTFLIKAGANLTAINGDGDMPHDIAEDEVMQQYLENELIKTDITEEVLEEIRDATHSRMLADVRTAIANNQDLNQPLDQGGTFLHVAIANGFNDIVGLLLNKGASVNARDEDGWEPIHVAAYWCNERAIGMLSRENNVDFKTTTDNRETPYDLCEDPELKQQIIHTISTMSMKYGSVKPYNLPELKTSFITGTTICESDDDNSSSADGFEGMINQNFTFKTITGQVKPSDSGTDHIDNVENYIQEHDSDNSDEKEKLPTESSEDTNTPYPLLNLQASELSERRNSIKEAKHLAPLKRASSLRGITTIQEKNEKEALVNTDRIIDSIISLSSNSNNLPNTTNGYVKLSTTSTDDSPPSDDTKNSFQNTIRETVNTTEINTNELITKPLATTERVNPDVIIRPSTTRGSGQSKNQAPPPPYQPRPKSAGATSTLFQSSDQPKTTSAHRRFSLTTELNNNQVPTYQTTMKTTLTDLKKQRQEARKIQRDRSNTEERPQSRSSFYDVSEIYEPPPSPTMIRYRLKMSQQEMVSSKIIKEKKCIIM